MIRLQSHFATDGYEKLGGIQRYFAEGVREEYASGGLDAQVSSTFLRLAEALLSSDRSMLTMLFVLLGVYRLKVAYRK